MLLPLAELASKRNGAFYGVAAAKKCVRVPVGKVIGGLVMSGTKISAIEVLGDALTAVWREKELAGLLMALLAVLNLIILWPIMEWYLSVLPSLFKGVTPSEQDVTALEDNMSYIFWMIAPMLVAGVAAIVLWTRAVTGGTSVAFEGGFKALIRRILWTLWRYLCGVGWMLLILVPFAFFAGLVFGTAGIGASGQGGGGATALSILALMVMYLVILFASFAISFLMMVSFQGEARDLRLPIHRSFSLARGNILRSAGVMLLALLGFYIVSAMVGALFGAALFSGSTILQGIALFVLFFLGHIMNFVFIGYGALFAVRLVPELKG